MSTQTPWSSSSKNGSGCPGWLSEKLSCLRRANLFWRALSIFLTSMWTSWADACTSCSNKADTRYGAIWQPSCSLDKKSQWRRWRWSKIQPGGHRPIHEVCSLALSRTWLPQRWHLVVEPNSSMSWISQSRALDSEPRMLRMEEALSAAVTGSGWISEIWRCTQKPSVEWGKRCLFRFDFGVARSIAADDEIVVLVFFTYSPVFILLPLIFLVFMRVFLDLEIFLIFFLLLLLVKTTATPPSSVSTSLS